MIRLVIGDWGLVIGVHFYWLLKIRSSAEATLFVVDPTVLVVLVPYVPPYHTYVLVPVVLVVS